MRIVTARSPSPSPSPSPPASPSKRGLQSEQEGGPWRRVHVDTVLTFPSSKRVQRPPHSYAPKDKNKAQAKSSVWVRVSDKSTNAPRLDCNDLEVSVTAKKKIIPDDEASDMDVEADARVYDLGTIVVDVSHKFTITDPSVPAVAKVKPLEADSHKLSQRRKQIDYGKNTMGYERYSELVPRNGRKKGDPQTPDIKQVCSKRSWDGQVKKWRRCLHEFDPPVSGDDVSPQIFSAGGSDTSSNCSNDEDLGKDATSAPPSTESEDNAIPKVGALAIYGDWDSMEP